MRKAIHVQQVKTFERSPFYAPPARYVGDKYPRTLQEAFGPYTSPLVDPAEQIRRTARRLFLVGVLASAAGFALLAVLLSRG